MDVSIAEAKAHLPELIRKVETGETVVITRHGKQVAQLAPVEQPKRPVILGGMRNRIKLLPGWDSPIGMDELLGDGG